MWPGVGNPHVGIASDAFDSSDPLKILSDCFRISFLTFVYDNVFFFDSFDFVQSRIYLSIYLSINMLVSFFRLCAVTTLPGTAL